MFDPVIDAIPAVLTWKSLLCMLIGMIAGLVIGALPGLTVVTGTALLIPLTFGMEPLAAMGLLAGMYNGGSYGGAITAILLRIPGTPASVATVFDGWPMTQRGEAAYALQVAVVSGTIGSVVSAISLIVLSPPLTLITLAFGPAEYFWVAMFGMATVSMLLGGDPLKGVIAALIGLLLGVVGQDPVTGTERFVFNDLELLDGFSIVTLLTGLYAIPPVLLMCEEAAKKGMSGELLRLKRVKSVFSEWTRYVRVWVRSSVIGIIIGILPGAGGAMTSIIAWNDARSTSKDPDSYGKGNPEGVAASECGNGADNASSMIPALTLGIPGSGVAAVILGGLLVHGLRPGPQLFRDHPDVAYGFMLQMLITAFMLIVLGGLLATRIFGQVLRLPPILLAPLIVLTSVVGVYGIHASAFDVWIMLAIGVVGYAMDKLEFPTAPAVLGLLLGPMAEGELRLALTISMGDASILFASLASWVTITCTLLVFLSPWLRSAWQRRKAAAG
jgi:putative tricarboxylic transport membrane protein